MGEPKSAKVCRAPSTQERADELVKVQRNGERKTKLETKASIEAENRNYEREREWAAIREPLEKRIAELEKNSTQIFFEGKKVKTLEGFMLGENLTHFKFTFEDGNYIETGYFRGEW